MQLDHLRSEVVRAVKAAFPETHDDLLSKLEAAGCWKQNPQQWLLHIGMLLGGGSVKRLNPLITTDWSGWQASGVVTPGQEITIGRDHFNEPTGIFAPGIGWRIKSNLDCVALVRLRMLVDGGDPTPARWYMRLDVNDRNYFNSVSVDSLLDGLDLPLPIVVNHTDDLRVEIRYHKGESDQLSVNDKFRFGLQLASIAKGMGY